MKIGVIGAGISGLSISNILQKDHDVVVFEASGKAGGLIECDVVNGNLYHKVGGHVFNSKNPKVLDWFWNFFDKENEFVSSKRNAKIFIGSKIVNYPIENFIYQLSEPYIKQIISELLTCKNTQKLPEEYDNFLEYLEENFGKTLCDIYFKPYNQKIWKTNLKEIPMNWLEGKLPMPNITEILLANILKTEENTMVHSSFFYPKHNGSQFIANRLANHLNIKFNYKINTIKKIKDKVIVNDLYQFDTLIYTGNIIKLINSYLEAEIPLEIKHYVNALKFNGTTCVLCTVDSNDMSWLYLPEQKTKAHRIIYTGNFSETNNDKSLHERISCTVEFSGCLSENEVLRELKTIPGNLKFQSYNYQAYSYVIQDKNTREHIKEIKKYLSSLNIHLLGRFAEWEYYNMDTCIEAAFNLTNLIRVSKK